MHGFDNKQFFEPIIFCFLMVFEVEMVRPGLFVLVCVCVCVCSGDG